MEGANRGSRSQEDEAARFLAQQWELEYRETHALSLDPSALGILGATEARRLEALPLEVIGDRAIVAVAEPTVERLAAVRAAAGENASFVVVSRSALEALLSSKVFNPGTPEREQDDEAEDDDRVATEVALEAPSAVAADEIEAPPNETTTAPPELPTSRPEPEYPDDRRDDAESRASLPAPVEPQAPIRPVLVAVGSGAAADSDRLDTLLRQISATSSTLALQVGELSSALEESHSELQGAREQLERARVENAQSRAAIDALGEELAASRAMSHATTARLRELVSALEGSAGGEGAANEYPPPAYESRIA